MDIVYRVKAVAGEGWVRSPVNPEHPQVTGLETEAHQFDDQAEAVALVARWNRRNGYVKVKVVPGERTDPLFQHGAP